jgi:hypothetical protein
VESVREISTADVSVVVAACERLFEPPARRDLAAAAERERQHPDIRSMCFGWMA